MLFLRKYISAVIPQAAQQGYRPSRRAAQYCGIISKVAKKVCGRDADSSAALHSIAAFSAMPHRKRSRDAVLFTARVPETVRKESFFDITSGTSGDPSIR